MKINTPAEYDAALERANQLRSGGAAADNNTELAILDAAIHAYEADREPTRDTPGRPAPASRGRKLPDAHRKG